MASMTGPIRTATSSDTDAPYSSIAFASMCRRCSMRSGGFSRNIGMRWNPWTISASHRARQNELRSLAFLSVQWNLSGDLGTRSLEPMPNASMSHLPCLECAKNLECALRARPPARRAHRLNAGDIIGEITLAVRFGPRVQEVVSTMHPYLTWAEGIKLAGQVSTAVSKSPWISRTWKWSSSGSDPGRRGERLCTPMSRLASGQWDCRSLPSGRI